MKPSAPAGFAGDTGRVSDDAGGRGAAFVSCPSAVSLENAYAGESAAISNSGTIPRHDPFMRNLMAF